MRYLTLPNNFFINNRKYLINRMKTSSIFIAFSPNEYPRNGDQYYSFRQNSDLYHLCGINQEETILTLTHFDNGVNFNERIFVKQVDEKQRIWYGEKHSKEEVSELSGIEDVCWNTEFEDYLFSQMEFVDTIYYVESANIKSFDNCASANERRIESLKKEFPEKIFLPITEFMQELRLVKQEDEINAIKKSVEITRKAYFSILKNTKPNKKEYEIEAEITYEFLKNGAQGHAYEPIVASGKNACILHYIDNDKVMKDGDLLLLDFGSEYANYAADCSRTIPINGKFTERQKQCYNAVLDVYQRAQKLYVPGNTIDIINEQVGEWMQEKMVELSLFSQEEVDNYEGEEPIYKRYFMHGTSHFMGLDVHDVGTKQTPFKEGMVLTCEPGLYIEEEGIGIRIETDIIVAEEPIDLMADYPVTVEEIEIEMR